jgi:hypothetical protein
MKPQTALQTLDYVEASGQALHAAQLLAEKVAADQQKVAQLVPRQVELLLQSGLIVPNEKQAASEMLATHEGVLGTVSNLIAMLGEQKQAYEQKLAAQGNGSSVKSAAAGGNAQAGVSRTKQADAGVNLSEGGNVGRRRGAGEKSAADMALIESLGLGGRIGKRS